MECDERDWVTGRPGVVAPNLRDVNFNEVCFTVAQRECAVHDTNGNRVIEWGSSVDSNMSSRDQAHLPDAPAEFPADLDCANGARLIFLHLSEQDGVHVISRF